MSKSDQSIHRICIASIKRHTILAGKFEWTRFYETEAEFISAYPLIENPLLPGECMICSVVLDEYNYSLLTTRKLITKENGVFSIAEVQGASDCRFGDFKKTVSCGYTLGSIREAGGTEVRYFIEAGPASMVMIYGLQTLLSIL